VDLSLGTIDALLILFGIFVEFLCLLFELFESSLGIDENFLIINI
jgi:hypothetical protein